MRVDEREEMGLNGMGWVSLLWLHHLIGTKDTLAAGGCYIIALYFTRSLHSFFSFLLFFFWQIFFLSLSLSYLGLHIERCVNELMYYLDTIAVFMYPLMQMKLR